jgi:hypothetical protein
VTNFFTRHNLIGKVSLPASFKLRSTRLYRGLPREAGHEARYSYVFLICTEQDFAFCGSSVAFIFAALPSLLLIFGVVNAGLPLVVISLWYFVLYVRCEQHCSQFQIHVWGAQPSCLQRRQHTILPPSHSCSHSSMWSVCRHSTWHSKTFLTRPIAKVTLWKFKSLCNLS